MSKHSKSNKKEKSGKGLKIFIAIVVMLVIAGATVYALDKFSIIDLSSVKEMFNGIINNNGNNESGEEPKEKEEEKPVEKVDIIDLNSNTRPFAVSINNTSPAVKVQRGLNNAYLIYEVPTEGNTSRLLAFFKDIDELTVGTIRSARHNFLDYCFESNAIFCHFGHSVYATRDINSTKIDDIDGFNLSTSDKTFWRNNPERLDYEHTAYTSIENLREYSTNHNFSLTADSAEATQVLKYNVSDVDLSQKEGATSVVEIELPYGTGFNAAFKYNAETKMYERYRNGNPSVDYETKEPFSAKNIIIQKLSYTVLSDEKHCLDLKTVSSGEGYFITNGYAVPIKWSKSARREKTVYTYLDGTEIEVSDGRTYIELFSTNKTVTLTPAAVEEPAETTEGTENVSESN